MCGIAGIVAPPGSAPDQETLAAMGTAQAHRGPDDGTTHVWGRAGLSFRRLSIIDVAGGRQPLDDCSGTSHIILNGEIYNHLELRAELEARGHVFRTHSDIEVAIHGYEEWGDGVVPRLRGMFALALWDEQRQRLLLARDRLGKKPLLYHVANGWLSFASEFQGLLAHPRVPREPDLAALHHYLTLQYVPSPLTAFAGVRKLPPAHTLVWENGRTRIERYWHLSYTPQHPLSRQDAAAEVRRLLRDAVKVRLMSEVPLGAFLSGGIDSGSIVALMAEFGPVKTFSIGFEEDAYDELPYAREVARRYGTDHHEAVVVPDAVDVLPRIVRHYGEPYSDSSALPTWYLAQMTREHVTVALNGDGGDELFAGYDRFKLLSTYALLARVPGGGGLARGLARTLGPRTPARLRRFLEAVSRRPEESYARTVSHFSPEQKGALYGEALLDTVVDLDSYQFLYDAYALSDAPDLLGRTLHVDTLTYLPDDLLVKVDIATMAHSLEGRSPFLDHPLVEFAARLPSSMKLGVSGGKQVLRDAVADLLPETTVKRRKQGFGVPVDQWFRSDLREMVQDTLLGQRSAQRGYFRPEAVRALWDDHQAGADRSPQLWTLLMLELWCREFVDAGPPVAEPVVAMAEATSRG